MEDISGIDTARHVANKWSPSTDSKTHTNIYRFMHKLGYDDLSLFHHWTCEDFTAFWQHIINELNIPFKHPYNHLLDPHSSLEAPNWLAGAKLNIVDACFLANPSSVALIEENSDGKIIEYSYHDLRLKVNQISNSLGDLGLQAGDAIAIIMPMHFLAVASYLAIVQMGGVVVSIAESFSSKEIATRLEISHAKLVITQDGLSRNKKQHPLYQRVLDANPPQCIIAPEDSTHPLSITLRDIDMLWANFISENDEYSSRPCQPMDHINILFSSGTTGTPKAIPWNHTTAIKAASDGFFHQDIQAHDRFCWPTSLGWMMGPWLIFACLINRASIALYPHAPNNKSFGKFVQNAGVSILGLVPTMVAIWRESGCMDHLNWDQIRLFSSSGECSNPDDMSYLMSLAGNKPIIEYCGGTEIGGAYISSTLIQDNIASQFSTPTMGMSFVLLDENQQPSNKGEVAIIAPSFGLSTTLLNANHHDIYFANMPKTPNNRPLRRHGDQLQRLPNGYYSVIGRTDDAMNLGGIKISAVEIERALIGLPHLIESAAIAITPKMGGASALVIFAVMATKTTVSQLKPVLQEVISKELNPLFRVHDVMIVDQLPKTASNKIMRRVLRDEYQKAQ